MTLKVVNAMLSYNKGGIEQASSDYANCLAKLGCISAFIASPGAPVLSLLSNEIEQYTINNMGAWDLVAAYKMRSIIRNIKPDVIITHGNRAASLLLRFHNNTIPIVNVQL